MTTATALSDFAKRLDQTAEDTEALLAKLLSDALLPDEIARPKRLMDAMRYSSLGGGKRLRPFLVVESSAIFGVPRDAALLAGAALECIHCYSLIHDDLPAMDDDDLRRGQPSCHKKFDEATAILAGDALQTRAFEVLAEADTHADAEARCELVLALAAASGMRGMVGGQMIDMQGEGKPLTAPEITRLQALKTGRLIQFSAEAGAILGRAPQAQRHFIAAYGRELGGAFQIYDDVLDETASAEELGKTIGKDAAQGKATMVSILGLDRARAQAERLAEQAAGHLESFGEKADLLRALAHFTVTRKS